MEIKVGDKVRVSKDAQEIFVYGLNPLWFTEESTVVGTHPDGVVIKLDAENHLATGLPIPTKYLTKVEDEAKAKYKAGDKVRVLGHALLEGGVFTITLVEHRKKRGWMYRINTHTWYPESDLEPYTEPTAPKIEVGDMVVVKPDAPNMCKSVDMFKHIKSVVTKIENGKATLDIDRLGNGGLELFDVPLEYIQKVDAIEHLHNHGWGDLGEFTPMPVSANPIIGFEQSYWQRYEADLAKELAIAYAKRGKSPLDAVAAAKEIAKSVIGNFVSTKTGKGQSTINLRQ